MATVSATYSELGVDKARPSLRRGAVWMLAGGTVYNISQLALFAVLARCGTAADVGLFVFGLSVTAPTVMFCNLQLRVALATDARAEFVFADYRALRYLMLTVGLAVILLSALVIGDSWQTSAVIVAVGISKIVESISDLHFGRLQRGEAVSVISRSLCIRGVGSVIAVAIAFLATQSVIAVGLSLALCWLVVLLMHDVPAAEAIGRREPPGLVDSPGNAHQRQVRLFWKVFPLGLATGFSSLEANVPRYVVAGFSDAGMLGIVGPLTYLLPLGQSFGTAICYPAIPRLAMYYSQSQMAPFYRLLGKLCLAGLFVGVIGFAATLIVGYQILSFALGPEYAAHWPLMLLMAAAVGVQLVLNSLLAGLRAMRQFRAVFVLQGAGLAATATMSSLFVAWWGSTGLGWAILSSSILLACAAGVVVGSHFRVRSALPSAGVAIGCPHR